jgi:hypothetical protein
VRIVHLNEDSEEILDRLVEETGMSISDVLKQGLLALRACLLKSARRSAYEVYEELDLGEGGYSVAASSEVQSGVKDAIRRKLLR